MLFNFYTCREALLRLDDYLDRELSEPEMRRVARHLRLCHACTRKFAFERQVLEETREKIRRVDVPDSLREEIAQALEQTETSSGA